MNQTEYQTIRDLLASGWVPPTESEAEATERADKAESRLADTLALADALEATCTELTLRAEEAEAQVRTLASELSALRATLDRAGEGVPDEPILEYHPVTHVLTSASFGTFLDHVRTLRSLLIAKSAAHEATRAKLECATDQSNDWFTNLTPKEDTK